MDTAGFMFTGLTIASVIATAGLTINLTENFGTLSTDSQVQTEVGGDRLVGTYANAVTGMSAVVVGLTGLYLIFYIYGWYRMRGNRNANVQRVYWIVILLAVMLGLSSAAVNLNLTENYTTLVADGSIVYSPNPPVAGQNYALRGSYGTATLGMAAASVSMAGIAWLWAIRIWWMRSDSMTAQMGLGDEVFGVGMGSARRKSMLDFTTL